MCVEPPVAQVCGKFSRIHLHLKLYKQIPYFLSRRQTPRKTLGTLMPICVQNYSVLEN